MTENTNVAQEPTQQDIEDLAALGLSPDGEPIPDHTLLRIWQQVLSNIEASVAEPIEMGVAGKVVASWPQLSFQDTQRYHELYHEHLLDIRSLLQATIDDHPGCADHAPEDDIAENYEIYKSLVIGWNLYFDDRESEWVATDPESHIRFAALVDCRATIFSRTGLAGHLEAREFNMDHEEIVEAIRANRGEK